MWDWSSRWGDDWQRKTSTRGRRTSYDTNFTFMWPCIVTNVFIIKSTICTNYTNLFWHETLHVSGEFLCPSSGVYSPYTQQWYMSYRFVDSFRAGPGLNCSKAVYKPVWHTIAEFTVNKLMMMDRGTLRNMQIFMPK